MGLKGKKIIFSAISTCCKIKKEGGLSMLHIKRIYKEDYPDGKKIIYQYHSDKFYDVSYQVQENGWIMDFTLKHYDIPFHKHLEGEIFADYIEEIECYVAEIYGEEVGIVSCSHEKWNNVLRINDIHVNPQYLHKGIGSQLMSLVKTRAEELGARAIVLETQTSNYPAIQFYKRHGFQLIGCDLLSYSNTDMENREVRIEMGLVLEA